jgi:tRNA A37 threonylcarbamoyltransferase TsaD
MAEPMNSLLDLSIGEVSRQIDEFARALGLKSDAGPEIAAEARLIDWCEGFEPPGR